MGLEVSSRHLQQADTPARTEGGAGRPPDASAKEQFERVMERNHEGRGSERHAMPDKDNAADTMPSPSALMESLFSGRMERALTTPGQVQAASEPGNLSDVGELVDKLVERILVSEPGKGAPEVRITLGDGALAGTELSLSRAQDGQLCVRLSCADAASFQTAVGAQDGLRAALERQGETVRLEIGQNDAGGGNEGDSRRRSQGLVYDAPQEV